MNKKSIYDRYEEIKQCEISELKEKLKAFGGVAHFGPDYTGEGATGSDFPFVLCNFDYGPVDMKVMAVSINNDELQVLGYDTEAGQYITISLDVIVYGHIEFITSAIPKKEDKRRNDNLVLETTVFMTLDIFIKAYAPTKGRDMFATCHEIIRLAKAFEESRTWSVDDDDYDEGKYFKELEEFEKKYLDGLS